MKRASRFTSSTVVALIFAGSVAISVTAAVAGAERKIDRSALPPAVEKTVQEQAQGAVIKGFSTETEGGVLEYEVEMTVAGHGKDVSIAKDGSVIEVEEEVALNSLPDAVQKGLAARAAGSKIMKVESLTKKGKLVTYEAHTGKKGEVQVGPNGERLKHEE
jgi:hypothetical protein